MQSAGQHPARQAGGDTGTRIDERHPQNISQRQHKGAGTGHGNPATAGANDDAGQDRQHRESAGRQGQQQAKAKETKQRPTEAGVVEKTCDSARLVILDGRSSVYWGHRRIGQLDAQRLPQRRITNARFGAPLRNEMQAHRQRTGRITLDRQTDRDLTIKHFDLTKGIVHFLPPLRKSGRPEHHIAGLGGKTELVAVQIISVGNLIAHFKRPPVEYAHRRPECIFRAQ